MHSRRKQLLNSLPRLRSWHVGAFAGAFAIVGIVVVMFAHAAGPYVATEAENGTISGAATTVTDASASGGQALALNAPTPTPTPTPTPGACPSSTHNVPNGIDPWGGCWPGPNNTGYPHGLAGDTRTPVTLTNYTGSCTITSAVTIDKKIFNCDVIIQAKVTITNSLINGQIIIDSDNAATQYNTNWMLTLKDSEVSIGLVQLPVVYEGAMDIQRSDIHGGVTAVQCGDKSAQCFISDSYLHGQQIQVNSNWHLGGFHSIGGTNYNLTHNWITCDQLATYGSDGGCSGGIVFVPTDPSTISHAIINKNFVPAMPSAAYCFYGGDRPPNNATYMTITNNVWGRGSNRLCGTYGPVAGTNTGSTNVWSGNVWEDGGAVDPTE